MCIEALDQLAHAACLFEARHTCRLRKGLRGCYREQRSGSSRYIYPFTTRFDDTLQFTLFLRAQGTQRMFLRVSHGRFPSFSPSFYHLRFPTDMQSLADPLVARDPEKVSALLLLTPSVTKFAEESEFCAGPI